MKVIGLTGGIGTGKSTVAQFLVEMGAVLLDADKLGHEAFKPGTQPWQDVVGAFGPEIIGADGSIDRSKLARVVFGHPDSLKQLNGIMHPAIYQMVKARIEECRRQGEQVVILEAALLLEAGWTPLVDEVWVTVAPEATVLKRLAGRSGFSERESLARIRSQLASEERAGAADIVIDTDCTLDEVRARVQVLWQRLTTPG